MADHADIATDTVEACTDEALRRALGKSAPEYDPAFDGKHCVDCDIDIPKARLNMGRVRCVDCQETIERNRAMAKIAIRT